MRSRLLSNRIATKCNENKPMEEADLGPNPGAHEGPWGPRERACVRLGRGAIWATLEDVQKLARSPGPGPVA